MTDQLPNTLAHLENSPLLTMTGEGLLQNQQLFKANLNKSNMNLDDLHAWSSSRRDSECVQNVFGMSAIENENYPAALYCMDELLVMWPMSFDPCHKLLEILYKLRMVELFNREAEYAHWLLVHLNVSDPEVQLTYQEGWKSIAIMGRDLDGENPRYETDAAPPIGNSEMHVNNLVAFYFQIDKGISDAVQSHKTRKLETIKLQHEESYAKIVCLTDADDKRMDQTAEKDTPSTALPELADSSAEQNLKRINLLHQRKRCVRQTGESWEDENGCRQVMICDKNQFGKRRMSEKDKENIAKLSALVNLTCAKELPPVGPEVFAEIKRIGDEQPNFSSVTEQILDTLHAQCLSGMSASLPPLLLYGAPGVGKTRYVKRIAAALGLPYCDIPLAGSADAFKISGLSRYWGSAGPGMIASTLADSKFANPVFLLDEIDKAGRSEQGDPLARILLLLEQETAVSFKDEFVDVPINAAFASYIATANEIDCLPEPLLNRFICIPIEPLDRHGRGTLVHTVYRELRTQRKYGAFLSQDIPLATLAMLVENEDMNGRALKRELQQAMQRACRSIPLGKKPNGAIALTPDCLRLPDMKKSKSMGFV